jgi:hypothetical protein
MRIRWLSTVVMMASLAAVPSAQGTAAATGRALTWRLASDFRVAPNQSNPNPDSNGNPIVWTFLRTPVEHDPTSYVLLNTFVPNTFGIAGLEQWQGPFGPGGPRNKQPAIGISVRQKVVHFGGITWPPRVVRVNPYTSQAAIVGWTSPVSGTFQVTLGLADMDPSCGNGITWSIDFGSSTIASGGLGNGQSSQTGTVVSVVPGDTLYFTVDAGLSRNDRCDSTALSVKIV